MATALPPALPARSTQPLAWSVRRNLLRLPRRLAHLRVSMLAGYRLPRRVPRGLDGDQEGGCLPQQPLQPCVPVDRLRQLRRRLLWLPLRRLLQEGAVRALLLDRRQSWDAVHVLVLAAACCMRGRAALSMTCTCRPEDGPGTRSGATRCPGRAYGRWNTRLSLWRHNRLLPNSMRRLHYRLFYVVKSLTHTPAASRVASLNRSAPQVPLPGCLAAS